MPPDLSIAGGEEVSVRKSFFWTQAAQRKPTTTSIVTNTPLNKDHALKKLAVVSPGSSIDTEESEVSSESSESDADDCSSSASSILLSESDSEDQIYPPSPPIKTIAIAGCDKIISPAVSVASSVDSDYFSSKSSLGRSKSFLEQVYPRSKVLGNTASLTIESRDSTWELAMTEELGARVLYAHGAGFEAMNLRENLVSLLDRADEELDCDQLVVVLDKHDANLSSILHSLIYVGGVVIPRSSASIHRKHSSSFVLVGIEI